MTTLSLLAGAAVAAVLAIVGAYFKGARAERNRAQTEQLRKQADAQKAYDRIDSESPDLDRAVDGLRKRAKPDDRP